MPKGYKTDKLNNQLTSRTKPYQAQETSYIGLEIGSSKKISNSTTQPTADITQNLPSNFLRSQNSTLKHILAQPKHFLIPLTPDSIKQFCPDMHNNLVLSDFFLLIPAKNLCYY